MVGRCGLSRAEIDGQVRLENGWTIPGDLWGRGYATEIGRTDLTYGFEDLDTAEDVEFTDSHDAPSRAMMERLGMRYSRGIVHRGVPSVLYTWNARTSLGVGVPAGRATRVPTGRKVPW